MTKDKMTIMALMKKPVADKKVVEELESIKKNLIEKNRKRHEEEEYIKEKFEN